MFIIICPIEFFVKQSCISCVIIVNIFVRWKIIGKDFRKIMQMKYRNINELIKYSFSFDRFNIFKSLKIGSVCSEYDLML